MQFEGMTAGKPYDFEQRKAYIKNDLLYAKYRKAGKRHERAQERSLRKKINREGLERFKKL